MKRWNVVGLEVVGGEVVEEEVEVSEGVGDSGGGEEGGGEVVGGGVVYGGDRKEDVEWVVGWVGVGEWGERVVGGVESEIVVKKGFEKVEEGGFGGVGLLGEEERVWEGIKVVGGFVFEILWEDRGRGEV